jgi:hypothetical protein
MSNKSELIEARAEILEVLDEKLSGMPEWRALRAIEKAIGAIDAPSSTATPQEANEAAKPLQRRVVIPKSYVSLALEALEGVGRPIDTATMLEYISARRKMDDDPKRARINVQSALSKDKRIESVPWRGGPAWWFADRDLPKGESAGSQPSMRAPADLLSQSERG